MGIRHLQPEEIEEALEFLKAYWKEADWKSFEIDMRSAFTSLYSVFQTEHEQCMVAIEDGKIVGVQLTECYPAWFSQDEIAKNLFVYVDKEYRGRMIGVQLLKSAIKFAKERKAKRIQVGVISGIDSERTKQLYTKLKFKEIGSEFIMEL